MRTTLVVAALAALVALTACTSSEPGSGSSAETGATGMTASTAPTTGPTTARTTATGGNGVAVGEPAPGNANSRVARFGVRRTDLPGDFAVTAKAKLGLPDARYDDALQLCTGTTVTSDDRVAGATSATFGSAYGAVFSTTERYSSARAVTAATAALRAKSPTRCFGRFFASRRRALTNNGAPDGSSVTVRPGTNDGPRNAAGLASAQYEYDSNGGTYPVSVSVYYLTGPTVLTRLFVISFGGVSMERYTDDVLFPVAARTAAG